MFNFFFFNKNQFSEDFIELLAIDGFAYWLPKILLFFLLTFPAFCFIYFYFAPTNAPRDMTFYYHRALYFSATTFLISLLLLFILRKEVASFQGIITLPFNINLSQYLSFGIDFISLSLIILTNLFIYLCILSIRFIEIKGKILLPTHIVQLFFTQWGLIAAFSALDLLAFFVFFETTLIPIFMIILQGGSRERKTRASYLIALYTLFGSVFMLFNIIYIFNKYGTTNYLYLSTINISIEDQKFLWITFFLAFAAKIPVFPFHIWLPEAHVEAPTIGSVLLAALLLKLGVYGLIRFGLPLFPYGQEFFKHFVIILTMCSFFYTNLTAIRQVDIKKIIAYSSVVHMNLIVLGILCISIESLDGAIFQMLAHGIVSGALFFCIGIIYERFKSRFLWYFGGIAFILPIYSIFLFIFILANISFPTTSNFIGEMLLFMGIFKDNFTVGVIATLSMFWGVIYNVWTYNRLCFGNIKVNYNSLAKHSNISYLRETQHNIDLDLLNIKPTYRNLIQETWTKEKADPFDATKVKDDYLYIVLLKRGLFWWESVKTKYKIYTDPNKIYVESNYENDWDKIYKVNFLQLDIDKKDFYILSTLTFFLFLTGIFSQSILDYISIDTTTIFLKVSSQF